MRVIGGRLRGKLIHNPTDKTTRPLKDMVRESIFNILEHSKNENIKFKNNIILDLFAGSGSFGIECLSRGVKKVIFIENYPNVLTLLKKNLSNLKSVQNFKIIEKDIYKDETFQSLKNNFDIIFLDPPYKDKKIEDLLIKIKSHNILKKNGIIILHRHKNEKDNYPTCLNLIEKKIYGISKIIFLSFLN